MPARTKDLSSLGGVCKETRNGKQRWRARMLGVDGPLRLREDLASRDLDRMRAAPTRADVPRIAAELKAEANAAIDAEPGAHASAKRRRGMPHGCSSLSSSERAGAVNEAASCPLLDAVSMVAPPRAMEGADDEATEEIGGGTDARQAPALEERDSRAPTVSLVTHNVDGLGDYPGSAADRMEAILTVLLQAAPDMILLQEVTMAMHAVVRRRLAGWKIYRLRRPEEDYFNVTATQSAPDQASSYAFRNSRQGRHLVTIRRGH